MIQRQKGCNDLFGREAKIWQYVNSVVDVILEKYNYNYIRTPIFEDYTLFHRGIGEASDIVSKETYDFYDKGKRHIALRPEGTAGVARAYIENKMYGDATQPIKVYYNGTMYRYERPQSGRDRELTQFGVEVLGSDDPMVDAEVISLAVHIFKMLGLKQIKVNINSLGDKESRDNYREALVKYFTPCIDSLCSDCHDRLNKNPLRMIDCKVDKETEIMKNAPKISDYLNEYSSDRFNKVKEYLDLLGVNYVVDDTVVRGLDYYSHTVFEIEAKVDGFGTNNVLGAGGRYNDLVKDLGGPETSCMGFASGVGRLVQALILEEVKLPIDNSIDLFLMYVSDSEKKNAIYLTDMLRNAGFKVETEYNGRSLKSQFKQADRLNSKFIAVLNDNSLLDNEITIKNNKTKEEVTISLDALIYFLEENVNNSDILDDEIM